MARTAIYWVLLAGLSLSVCPGQEPGLKDRKDRKTQPPPGGPVKEQEPPEEDEGLKPRHYEFNPLQADRVMAAGNFYYKKGNYRAAISRYREAREWDPSRAEAYLRIGEAEEKMRDKKAAKEAYQKYLDLAPDGKDAVVVKKRLSSL